MGQMACTAEQNRPIAGFVEDIAQRAPAGHCFGARHLQVVATSVAQWMHNRVGYAMRPQHVAEVGPLSHQPWRPADRSLREIPGECRKRVMLMRATRGRWLGLSR